MIRESPDQTLFKLEDREFASDPRDWCALRMLMEEIDEEMRMQRRHLLMRLAQWIMAHDLFRKIERRKMVMTDPCPRDVEYHGTISSSLFGAGKMLLLQLREHEDVDPRHLGVRFEDLRATVAAVERDYMQIHSGMTAQRKSQILTNVFGQ